MTIFPNEQLAREASVNRLKNTQTTSGGRQPFKGYMGIQLILDRLRLRKKLCGFYLETDISRGIFVIGKGRQKVCLTAVEVKMLGEWLKYHQSQLSSDM